MNVPRIVFLSLSTPIVVGTIVGIGAFIYMEYQARAGLPPEEQTADAIATLSDGAVCLGCDLGAIFLAMFGVIALLAVLASWSVYEVGRVLLIRYSTPK